MMDQLRVVLVHAPNVSARTPIDEKAACLLGNGKYLAAFFPHAGQDGLLNNVIGCRTERASSATSDFAPRCATSGQFCKAEVVGHDPFFYQAAGGSQTSGQASATAIGSGFQDRAPREGRGGQWPQEPSG